ncbi:MAG: hypothetical protein ACFCAD_16685 [Pleurocapsa sp.]
MSFIVNSFIRDRIKKREAILFHKSQTYNRKTIEFLTGIEYIKKLAHEAQEYQAIVQSISAKNKA